MAPPICLAVWLTELPTAYRSGLRCETALAPSTGKASPIPMPITIVAGSQLVR